MLIESHSQLVKYWCFGMATDPTCNPKVSVFDHLGMRLKIYKLDYGCAWQLYSLLISQCIFFFLYLMILVYKVSEVSLAWTTVQILQFFIYFFIVIQNWKVANPQKLRSWNTCLLYTTIFHQLLEEDKISLEIKFVNVLTSVVCVRLSGACVCISGS